MYVMKVVANIQKPETIEAKDSTTKMKDNQTKI